MAKSRSDFSEISLISISNSSLDRRFWSRTHLRTRNILCQYNCRHSIVFLSWIVSRTKLQRQKRRLGLGLCLVWARDVLSTLHSLESTSTGSKDRERWTSTDWQAIWRWTSLSNYQNVEKRHARASTNESNPELCSFKATGMCLMLLSLLFLIGFDVARSTKTT